MKIKIEFWLTVFLFLGTSAFLCEPVDAQKIFSDPVIQRNYDLIGQMQALKNIPQKPGTTNNSYNNRGNNSRSSGLSQSQIAQQQLDAAATAQNNQGLDAFNKKDWVTAAMYFQQALLNNPNDPIILRNLACAQNHEGIDAYAKGDYTTALNYFQQSLANDPPTDKDNHFIVEDIAATQGKIADAQRAKEQLEKDKINANNIQQSIQNLAQTMNASPSTGGLDFMSANSQLKPALEFGDPMVVNAPKVPSGLPKNLDDAIASGYASAPAGVGDRVRKAFQAITTHDWKVARAWFQDALNHDPNNVGLKRLVDLADYTEKFIEQKSATTLNTLKKPLTSEEIPAGADEKTYALNSGKIHTHEAWEKFIKTRYPKNGQLELPKDSDIEFLFPGLPAIQAQEMEDYIEKDWIKATLNDPQLIRVSQPKANQPKKPVTKQPKNPYNPYKQ